MTEHTSGGNFNFSCVDCDHPFDVPAMAPLADDAEIRCDGCGRAMGTFRSLKQRLIDEAKVQIELEVRRQLGEDV